VTVRRRLALLCCLAFLAFGSAGAAGPASGPTAAAGATAIQITIPNGATVQTQAAAAPPASSPVLTSAFAYPDDGSIVAAASTTASASTTVAKVASAKAEADLTSVSLFQGEVTAESLTARASAGTGPSGAGGNQNGTGVSNLRVEGQPISGTQAALGNWGKLTLDETIAETTAPAGTLGYHGTVTALDVHLLAAHGGLPAGSDIRIGLAEAAVQTAPPAPPATTTTAPTTSEPTTTIQIFPDHRPIAPKSTGPHPLQAHPKLAATGGYTFPVFGPVSFGDSYGGYRADVSYHHGDDIFGRLGQPIVACVTGTVFSVGWNKIGGNRLWLLDDQGNQFYYAHLSAFSTAASDGARVRKGEVIGFMGDTGDAEGTPYHLHFEVHPVKYLFRGYDGAVDPTKYLDAWRHLQDLPFPVAGGWVPEIEGGRLPPEPGAVLLGMRDISSANGLDPSSLRRALTPTSSSSLMQTLIPSAVPAPKTTVSTPTPP
jgi:murein DD-endopeptidase MepM/ murein hydrolase activator NlpD